MIEIILPLPPSKNRQTVRKAVPVRGRMKYLPVLAPEVLDYRALVALRIKKYRGELPDNRKIVLECVWYRESSRSDVHNFHAQLADAIAPALGLDDKWFLLRDMDMVNVPRGKGRVWIQMRTLDAIDDGRADSE